MATQWWREPWRKLYTKLDAQWLGLTVSARGLADELIKYADEAGRLFKVDTAAAAGKEIAIRLSAKKREYKRIAEDTRDLLDDTYLVLQDGWLVIRNFADAQERLSPDARRQRAKRERDRLAEQQRDSERDMSRDDRRDESRDQGVTTPRDSHRESIRSESSRVEERHTHARARAESPDERVNPSMLLAAWTRAGLGVMQDPSGMEELRAALNRPDCDADPFAYCEAWKRLSAAWRRGGAKGSGESPRLMLQHMDKVHLVVTGELDPEQMGKNGATAAGGGRKFNEGIGAQPVTREE